MSVQRQVGIPEHKNSSWKGKGLGKEQQQPTYTQEPNLQIKTIPDVYYLSGEGELLRGESR